MGTLSAKEIHALTMIQHNIDGPQRGQHHYWRPPGETIIRRRFRHRIESATIFMTNIWACRLQPVCSITHHA